MYFSANACECFYKRVEVRPDGGCWLWCGAKTRGGYGLFFLKGYNNRTAHRYAKEMQIGERIPHDLDASHLCHNRACVNPDHIVVETRQMNIGRSRKMNIGRSRKILSPDEHENRAAAHRAKKATYYQAHRTDKLAKASAYYQAHRTDKLAKASAYYAEHKESILKGLRERRVWKAA